MIDTSKIALGTMQFLWTTSEKEAFRILDKYYELGGNIIDTADMYTNWVPGLNGGEAETVIGKWIKRNSNRDKLVLMSKVGAKVWEGDDSEGLGKKHILKAIDRTLKRLQTDYLDIYISHWSDPSIPIEETLLAYRELIKRGKIRSIGCSNYTKEELEQALHAGNKIDTRYIYLQAYYNVLDRKSLEEQLLPLIKGYDMNVFIYGPLASGFLTGAYRKDKPVPEHLRAEFVKEKMTEENFAILEVIDEIAKKYDATASQVALAWLLQKGYTPIIGADTIMQVKENMGALHITLEAEDIEILDNLT